MQRISLNKSKLPLLGKVIIKYHVKLLAEKFCFGWGEEREAKVIVTKEFLLKNNSHIFTDSVLIVTDIHIRSPEEENYRLLLNLLGRVDSSEVEYFVLLGDVFDFCYGRSSYFCKKFSLLVEVLEKLAKTSTKVIFVQGNHEFSLERMPWKKVEIVERGTKVIKLKDGKKIALCHGDYLIPKREYFFYMGLVRSEVFQRLTGLIPGFLVDKICLKLSALSRKKHKRLDRENLKRHAEKWLLSTGASLGFAGHYHMSLEHNFEEGGKPKKMTFVNSWV